MILPSNSCPLIHPDNNASNFIVELQNPIYLDGSWEVAMMDFTFVYYPISLYSNAKINFVYRKDTKYDVIITVNHKDKTLAVTENGLVTVKDNNILHFQSLYPYEIIFNDIEAAHNFGFGFGHTKKEKDHMTKYWSYKDVDKKDDKKVDKYIETVKMKLICHIERHETIRFGQAIKTLEDLNGAFKKECIHVFKSYELNSSKLFTFTLADNVTSVTFDKILVKTLGLERDEYTLFEDGNVIVSVVNPKILSFHHQMFIYSNIVEPIIVGDVKVPLLKSVWIEKHETDEVVQISSENPMYLPISTTCINNIEINIRDDSGKFIKFPLDSKTHLTLHFRKIND